MEMTHVLGAIGGFGAAAGYTLQFDVLPVGPDGRPKSAARDMSVQATASIVPNMVMPAVLGARVDLGSYSLLVRSYTRSVLQAGG